MNLTNLTRQDIDSIELEVTALKDTDTVSLSKQELTQLIEFMKLNLQMRERKAKI